MSGSNIGLLVVGILFAGFGIVFTILRSRISDLVAFGQRTFFGTAGQKVAPRSTPGLSVMVGVIFLILGAGAILSAVLLKVTS